MRNLRATTIMILLAAALLVAPAAHAAVRLPKVIGPHMVLQRDRPVVLWGWADPGERVTASAGGASVAVTADDKGAWRATLPAMKASATPVPVSVAGSNTIALDDVLVGDVWLCSGQSNMEFGLTMAQNGAAAVAEANDPGIRLMKVGKSWKPTPQDDIAGQWQACAPASVSAGGWGGFSAVGYFFGRELHKELGVPIGLIDATWGGTRIESWTPPQGFSAVPALATEYQRLLLGTPGTPAHDRQLAEAIDHVDAWVGTARRAVADHAQPPPVPAVPAGLLGPDNVQAATALYNGMIHPICPFGIRGAIWYQGESNEAEGALYTERMRALVGGWRSVWGQADLPFYYVQIAPYKYGGKPSALPEFWAAQAAAEASIPNTGMVVINDIGNPTNIHPTDKLDVGHRLAARALEGTYGRADVVGRSPTFKSMAAEGASLRVTFDHVGTGLASRDGKPLTWFEIADADSGGFRPAAAAIDGASVLLTAGGVKSPSAVRFAWGMLAAPNLMNSAGLPASAFRAGTIPVRDDVTPNVPELKGYRLVYDLDLSTLGPTIRYATDDHAAITGPFDRIAYAMELVDGADAHKWVYASMDAFTDDAGKIGVPTVASGARFQQNLSHLNVFSNVSGVTTGTDLAGGNIEFWPNSYTQANAAHVPNASDATFDFGDQPSEQVDGYGSMQIHNHDARQTLLAVNDWREGEAADVGIGSAPTGNPDWTFARNAGSYTSKRLRVFVRQK
jgi:sialate O-acetylesterase